MEGPELADEVNYWYGLSRISDTLAVVGEIRPGTIADLVGPPSQYFLLTVLRQVLQYMLRIQHS